MVMKVKIKEYTTTEKEIDLEYPIYLYWQSELGEDEVVKVMPEYRITVFYKFSGVEIKQEKHYNNYQEYQIIDNQTTEEHFNSAFDEATEHLIELTHRV